MRQVVRGKAAPPGQPGRPGGALPAIRDTFRRLDDSRVEVEVRSEPNEGAHLRRPAILGQSLWDHVTETTTRMLDPQRVARVRQPKPDVLLAPAN